MQNPANGLNEQQFLQILSSSHLHNLDSKIDTYVTYVYLHNINDLFLQNVWLLQLLLHKHNYNNKIYHVQMSKRTIKSGHSNKDHTSLHCFVEYLTTCV